MALKRLTLFPWRAGTPEWCDLGARIASEAACAAPRPLGAKRSRPASLTQLLEETAAPRPEPLLKAPAAPAGGEGGEAGGAAAPAAPAQAPAAFDALAERSAGELAEREARRLETFIICKGRRDRYFRSNPPWIALYVVRRFKGLLLRTRSNLLLDDYSLLANRMSTPSHKELTLVRSPEDILYQEDANRLIGVERPFVKQGSQRERVQHARQRDLSLEQSRRVGALTLENFPFPSLKIFEEGSMRFREVLRYFKHEVGCEVVRSWTEGQGKDLVEYAELTTPLASPIEADLPDITRERLWRRKARTVTPAARVLAKWLGEDLPAVDPFYGILGRGAQWQGNLTTLGSVVQRLVNTTGERPRVTRTMPSGRHTRRIADRERMFDRLNMSAIDGHMMNMTVTGTRVKGPKRVRLPT